METDAARTEAMGAQEDPRVRAFTRVKLGFTCTRVRQQWESGRPCQRTNQPN